MLNIGFLEKSQKKENGLKEVIFAAGISTFEC